MHAHEQTIAAGVKYSGCTVHFVVPEMDAGPIIAQAVVPVLADDDAHSLGQRILRQEHQIYPQVIRWIAEDRVVVGNDGRVAVRGSQSPDFAQINPVNPQG